MSGRDIARLTTSANRKAIELSQRDRVEVCAQMAHGRLDQEEAIAKAQRLLDMVFLGLEDIIK